MRFYDITITDQTGNTITLDGVDGPVPMHWASHKNGVMVPGALNVEWDVPTAAMDTPVGDSYVKIWGIDLLTLNRVSNLRWQNITIQAGMQSGLPLATEQAQAKPARNGIIFQGTILQPYGNWQGVEQSLDFVVTTQIKSVPTDIPSLKKLLVFDCAPNQSFASALQKTVSDAKIVSSINIDPRLVASERITFSADNAGRFGQQIAEQSINVLNDPTYSGVKMVKTASGYDFVDQSFTKTGIPVLFNDLIGQPTWIQYLVLQLKLVMRSDIKVGDTIILPKNTNIIQQAKAFNPSENLEFTGTAWVQQVRHVANFRQADANSWVTVIDVIINQKK
ncbi:MAG TPA: hypothetical protein VFM18_07340 [Methanosarcina sp.]|nr:hypothetical protein [Methanosarcina sp.]